MSDGKVEDDPRRCGAKTRSTEEHRGPGTPCRHWAGFRTSHPGTGRCYLHGGATPAHKTRAITVEAKQRMVKLGTPIEDVTAPSALMGLLRSSAGHVSWLQSEVAGLESLGSHEAEVLVRLYSEERDRLARISEAAVRAGVAEAVVKMERTKAETAVHAVKEAARDAGLNARQLEALGVALRKRLADALTDPDQAAREAAQADARLAKLREEQATEEERRVTKLADRRAKELSKLTFPPEEWAGDGSDPAA